MNFNIQDIKKEIIYMTAIIDKMLFSFRSQNYDKGLRQLTNILTSIESLFAKLIENTGPLKAHGIDIEVGRFSDILNPILDAQENSDYILTADLFELSLMPFLQDIQSTILLNTANQVMEYDVNSYKEAISRIARSNKLPAGYSEDILEPVKLIQQGYQVEYTSCGALTVLMNNQERPFYLHSNSNVYHEASTLAASWYKGDKDIFIIYGLGLGYHIEEMLELDESIRVEVYESDWNVLKLSCAYGVVQKIMNVSRLKLIYDPDFKKLVDRLGRLENQEEFVIHYPSLKNIRNADIQNRFEEYFIQYSSIKNQLDLLNRNFKSNIRWNLESAEVLERNFSGKNVYIVAAGPSLDKNYRLLKERKKDSILVATGTVFRKLLQEGIRPDYVIVSDANPRVYGQIDGLEDLDIPMLVLSTAYRGFAESYHGRKYIVLQEGFNKSEEYAKEKGLKLFETGGSVSTTALDVAIKLGAGKIIFLGLDLAYTDNYVHASNTSRRELTSTVDLRKTLDIHGNFVYTSKSLLIYKNWIENHVTRFPETIFINATEGGALIKGMINMRLEEFQKE